MLTVSELKNLVNYDPGSGIVTWKARPRVRAGKIVGSIHSAGYLEARIGGCRVYLHRVGWALMTGTWPDGQIDHINGDRNDNRWSNLRLADQQHNSANMKKRANNKCGWKGVVRRSNRWLAYIHIGGKTHYLGTFSHAVEAHNAYVARAKQEWREFSRAS